MGKLCVIVGACGPAEIYIPPEGAYVIACDKGLELLGDIKADLAVGDFDSLGYIPQNMEVLFHKPEKDDTDVMLAVRRAFELGFTDFALYGCMGGRIDHAYANYQVLAYIDTHGGRAFMAGDGWTVTLLRDGEMILDGKKGDILSVFAYGGDAEGVGIKNAKYTLDNYHMTPAFPIGVSNEFIGGPADISVKKGALLIMAQGGPELLCRGSMK